MKPSCSVFGCTLALFGFLVGSAGAQIITEFSAGITPGAGLANITAGPDGNLWFTETAGKRIGRITPQGVVTEFSAGVTGSPYDITAGPDGNLWFTESGIGRIGRITPDGVVTEFSINSGMPPPPPPGPFGITVGRDGNLWFTKAFLNIDFPRLSVNRIGQMTPDGVVTEFRVGDTLAGIYDRPYRIATGPDGNLWYTDNLRRIIGRFSLNHIVTRFNAGITTGDVLEGITAGPDGNLWFTKAASSASSRGSRIARIDPLTGSVTEFSVGLSADSHPMGIAAGPDGKLWFTENIGNRIGRIDPASGAIIEFSAGITGDAGPNGITTGPDGNLWFTESRTNRIGRISPCQNEAACWPPRTTVASSLNPSQKGQAVVFTASVGGNFPTGTVQFMAGGNPLGSPVTLSGGGIAQFMTSTLTLGTHVITAVYSGDSNNPASASAALAQIVAKVPKRHR